MVTNGEPIKVFYSWQSDTPNSLNRNFIESALEKAIRRIGTSAELSPAQRVELDKDTKGVTGSPPIAETILAKIEACAAFVADLTPVGESRPELKEPGKPPRLFPNPNVLIEYGYALHSRTDKRIVAVMNTAYGGPEQLPFDLKHKTWPIGYELKDPNDPEKSEKRDKLARAFEKALRGILEEHQAAVTETATRRRKEIAVRVKKQLLEMAERFENEGPEMAQHWRMLLTAIAEESMEGEEEWEQDVAYKLIENLHWGRVTEYGRKELSNNWVETAGSFSTREDRPTTLVRVWDNWAITASGEFWMYRRPKQGETGEEECFAAKAWEDETIQFVKELGSRMRQKWPRGRIFLQMRMRGAAGQLVLYDHEPLWQHTIGTTARCRLEKDVDSRIVTVEATEPVDTQPLIATVWHSLGMPRSPRHNELFEKKT